MEKKSKMILGNNTENKVKRSKREIVKEKKMIKLTADTETGFFPESSNKGSSHNVSGIFLYM